MTSTKPLIDKLTPEQEARIPEFLERFRAIGLSTSPTDRAKAESAIKDAYVYLNKTNKDISTNPEIVWAESPMEGIILAAQYDKGDTKVTTEEVQQQASKASYGSFEAYWLSVYGFIAEVLPVDKDELYSISLRIIENCGVYWTFEDLVIMTPKPSVIAMKDEKLHNTEGPALAYPNGDAIYAVNGEVRGSLMEVAIANRVADESV